MRRKKNKVRAILFILILSIAIGFLGDFLLTKMEKLIYPIKYEDKVTKYSELYGVPVNIIYSTIKVESGFKADAVSSANAIGLMQLTKDTFEWIQLYTKETLDVGLLYDPETNIKYGTFLLSFLYSKYGDWDLVHLAYNAGYSRVNEWLENPEYSQDGKITKIPFEETDNYLKKINKTKSIYIRLYGQGD